VILQNKKFIFWKEGLPPLAGFGPKIQLGLLEPKTEAKKNKKNFMILQN
jgi:hypothetical protein